MRADLQTHLASLPTHVLRQLQEEIRDPQAMPARVGELAKALGTTPAELLHQQAFLEKVGSEALRRGLRVYGQAPDPVQSLLQQGLPPGTSLGRHRLRSEPGDVGSSSSGDRAAALLRVDIEQIMTRDPKNRLHSLADLEALGEPVTPARLTAIGDSGRLLMRRGREQQGLPAEVKDLIAPLSQADRRALGAKCVLTEEKVTQELRARVPIPGDPALIHNLRLALENVRRPISLTEMVIEEGPAAHQQLLNLIAAKQAIAAGKLDALPDAIRPSVRALDPADRPTLKIAVDNQITVMARELNFGAADYRRVGLKVPASVAVDEMLDAKLAEDLRHLLAHARGQGPLDKALFGRGPPLSPAAERLSTACEIIASGGWNPELNALPVDLREGLRALSGAERQRFFDASAVAVEVERKAIARLGTVR